MQQSEQSAPLTVFKASAGSGKTFTLAVEYIKLLIVNPEAYRSILAVTFTNKATDEMKMRILSQLYGLSHGLPDSQAYMDVITNDLHASPEFIRSQAARAMTNLLHNYHYFRVQTIDAFFQTVLKNMARELQLNANLRVGLNQEQVIDQAVDEIIDSLAEDKQLMGIVMEYIHDNMDADKSWNPIGSIKSFGKNIYEEEYKQNREALDQVLGDQKFFTGFKRTLNAIIKETKEKYVAKGKEGIAEMEKAGLGVDDFFYGKSGVINYFFKLAAAVLDDNIVGKRVEDAKDNPSKWGKKNKPQYEAAVNLAKSKLIPLLNEIEKSRSRDYRRYNSAKITLQNINNIRLLKFIEDTTHRQNEDVQRFMLSDTQSFLREMIGEDDSPFIFEKIGAHLEHIMIDEFQDTSVVQWANFKTLLNECMSHTAPQTDERKQSQNIIVGDVKQSIYRFRSGDWRLLNDIQKEFRPEQLAFEPRLTNYRSSPNIVAFNNIFFELAAQITENIIGADASVRADAWAAQLKQAYKDVKQFIPDNKKDNPCGMVHIELLTKDEMENIPPMTLETIRCLIERGERPGDIAILTRNTKEMKELAKYIEENSDYRVISNEAFQLGASPAVRVIVNAMKVLAHPDDDISLATLVKDYQNGVIRQTADDSALYGESLWKMLPEGFSEEQRRRLLTMPLTDMAEQLIILFSVNGQADGQAAYVNCFMDKLHEFCTNSTPIIEDFLKDWDTEIFRMSIQSSDTNGIRLLTIHKSKGLEFKHVLLPYCNWKFFSSHGTTIWVNPQVAPFSDIPVLPVTFTNKDTLKNSIYEDEGLDETVQTYVDNLNLLYVAMTRAGHSLFIFGQRDSKEDSKCDGLIQKVIEQLPKEIAGVPLIVSGLKNEPVTLTFGTLKDGEKKSKAASTNVFTPVSTPVPVGISSYNSKGKYCQSNESRRFADDCANESDRQRMVRLGTVMHQIFSTIQTLADLEPALQRMEFDGTLYDETLTKDDLLNTLRQKFADPQVKDWFSNRWRVYNERSIILPQEGEQRPDRVITDGKETIVIDFKFGSPHPGYHEQVDTYVKLLTQMGLPNVHGYLWYISRDEIVAI